MIETKIEWFTPSEKTPEYTFRSGRDNAVHLLISISGLTVQGMYVNGRYEVFGISGTSQNIDYWAYIPEPK